MLHINDLPTEILVEIFNYLSPHDWIMMLPEVCNEWNSITASYISFWKDICVFIKCEDFYKTDIPVIQFDPKGIFITKQGLLKVKNVFNLKIIGMLNKENNLEEILNSVHEECKELKHLACNNCNGDVTENFIDLLNVLYPNLKSLNFTLSSSSCNKIRYDKISNFKHLESLMSDDHCFSDSDLVSLAKSESALTTLAIPSSHDITDYGLIRFLNSHKSHLDGLYISGYRISKESYSVISQCHELRILSVYDARQLNNEEFISLSMLPKLQVLSLHRATFKIPGFGYPLLKDVDHLPK